MCLVVKDSKYKIADNDIICYKVLMHGKKWITPFNHTIINNKVINGKEVLTDIKEFDIDFIEEFKRVNEGGFHCFVNKKDADDDANTCYNAFVFECVIPKGSIYYEGDFYGWRSYAAKQLKFIKQFIK